MCCQPKINESARLTGFEGGKEIFYGAHVYPQFNLGEFSTLHSGKATVLECLLKSVRGIKPPEKVVVVSNFTKTIDFLQTV